jgi:transcriptional regulator with XRE-family HTH domain
MAEETIGQRLLVRLRDLAETAALTHGQMKTKGVKVSQATISRLLSGKGRTDPGIDQLMQIAAGLDVDFLALLVVRYNACGTALVMRFPQNLVRCGPLYGRNRMTAMVGPRDPFLACRRSGFPGFFICAPGGARPKSSLRS